MIKDKNIKIILFFLMSILFPVIIGCDDTTDEVYPFHEVEVKPEPIYIPPPEYPELAKKLGQEGTVVVNIVVDVDGTVAHAEVQLSSGYWLLDNAALDAARRALFKPGMIDNEPVRCWVSIPYTFQLRSK